MTKNSAIKEKCARQSYDAVVIGSGPNGMAAAIVLAQRGMSVLVVEAQPTIGGGCRSAELTLPGFVHDICSSIHPLGLGSPFFRTLPLEKYGLSWIHPLAPYAHPFDGGKAVVVERSAEATATTLGIDGKAYERLVAALNPNWDAVCDALLHPGKLALHPFVMAKFGLRALMSARAFVDMTFKGPLAKGMFAGVAAHSSLPLTAVTSASFGLVLGLAAHAVGWPMPAGGAQELSDALAAHLRQLGGEILTSAPVLSLDDLPQSRLIMGDITPRQLLSIAGDRLPPGYRKKLAAYKYGPGTFKLDLALDGPIPWAAEGCNRSATVHLGGTFEEIAESEHGNWSGRHAQSPYVLLAQHTLFDPSRAPSGKQTVWAYCHVPNGSQEDMTERIENQIERFAPGFKNLILSRSAMPPKLLEEHNANYIGGDINGGALIPSQLFTRPILRLIPYGTPAQGLYLCSSATPPGGGVHGMCGYFAANAALRGWS
jgi:phytoene dehydrogenase-like protein